MKLKGMLEILEGYKKWKNETGKNENHWIETSITPEIQNWPNKLKNIVVLCDPIRRLFSDLG